MIDLYHLVGCPWVQGNKGEVSFHVPFYVPL